MTSNPGFKDCRCAGKWAILLFAVFLCALLAGCDLADAGQSADTSATQVHSTAPPDHLTAPIKVIVEVDKTGSATPMGVVQPEPPDLEPLIELIVKKGGEVAVGTIREKTGGPLIRLRIEEPAEAPDQRIDPRLNPFEQADRQNDAEERRKAFEAEMVRRRDEQHNRITAFREALRHPLEIPANAQRSDVWGAVGESSLFLSEPDAGWQHPPHKYAVFLSDGLDNVHKLPTNLPGEARVLVVNSSGSVGVLTRFNPARFEARSAAFAYISGMEGR